jgi:hypothetical protein
MLKIDLNNLRLTSHARTRIKERSQMTGRQMLEFVKNGVVAGREFGSMEMAVVFWSHVDSRAYVAVFNRQDDVVLTVFPAYEEREDGSVRMSLISPDWAIGQGRVSKEVYREFKVHRHEVRHAMQKAGIAPDPRFFDVKEEERNVFVSAIVTIKSYSYAEGEPVFITRTRFFKGDREEEPGTDEYFKMLAEKILRKLDVDDILKVDVIVTVTNGSPRKHWLNHGETTFKKWETRYSAEEFFRLALRACEAEAAGTETFA